MAQVRRFLYNRSLIRLLNGIMRIFIGLAFGFFVALAGFAQSPTGMPVELQLQVSLHAYLLPEGAYVLAPADMFIHPVLKPLVT